MFRLIKIDHEFEEVSRVYLLEFVLKLMFINPLRRKLRYLREGIFYECFLNYENITNICFCWGSQSHKCDSFMFNSRRIALKVENLPEISQVDETLGLNKEDETHS